METVIRPASDMEALAFAIRLLRMGQMIAYPTDTIYGLGASGFNEQAIEMLFAVKDRDRGRAIPYLLASSRDLAIVARRVPKSAQLLAEKFWPGGLTLVLPASSRVPRILIAEGDSVAVRIPNHTITRALIEFLGAPLTGTSANISGGRDPSDARQVLAQLEGRIPLILDGGPTQGTTPSTVVDVTTDPPKLVRAGVISKEEIEKVIGLVQ